MVSTMKYGMMSEDSGDLRVQDEEAREYWSNEEELAIDEWADRVVAYIFAGRTLRQAVELVALEDEEAE